MTRSACFPSGLGLFYLPAARVRAGVLLARGRDSTRTTSPFDTSTAKKSSALPQTQKAWCYKQSDTCPRSHTVLGTRTLKYPLRCHRHREQGYYKQSHTCVRGHTVAVAGHGVHDAGEVCRCDVVLEEVPHLVVARLRLERISA